MATKEVTEDWDFPDPRSQWPLHDRQRFASAGPGKYHNQAMDVRLCASKGVQDTLQGLLVAMAHVDDFDPSARSSVYKHFPRGEL
jgi:hypothetical protein